MHQISEILFRTYERLYREGQVSFLLGEANKAALDSVVKTVEQSYFGIERYSSDEEKAAAYLCHIIKRHALTDGNKRLALLWFDIYCSAFKLAPETPSFGYDALAVMIERTEARDLPETIEIMKWYLFDRNPKGK